jgi:acyl transferase domain-containing protein/acyl carrier protein
MRSTDSTANEAMDVEAIAIVGLGCRFPGASGPVAYWDLLCSGTDAMREVPKERWNLARFATKDPDRPGKTTVRKGGFLDFDPTEFDAAFFGISAREARYMDPQQRLIMEVAWEAVEDAGLDAAALGGSLTGVYVAAFTMDHTILSLNPLGRELIDAHSATGGSMTMLSNRVSYYFDFRGPSMTVDTACSGSLVAVHLASQAIWNGECEMALAGGVNVMLRPEYFIIMSKGRFLSPDGQCKSFDAGANGYARGEGAGMVVLKKLSSALRDGNPIYALIKGTGINQDGRTDGITLPSPEAQETLIRGVASRYRVPLGRVRYVEAHGTGTLVGDPIEAGVLGRTVGAAQLDGDVCLIGSAKAAIGHLEAAAGVAGLIKATLCAHFGEVPPQAGLEAPNPKIPFDSLRLRLTRAVEPLVAQEGPLYVGVNAFGYGGTNAHVILEQYGSPAPVDTAESAPGRPGVLVLSAKSPKALTALARAYSELLQRADAPSLYDICYSAFNCRTQLTHRLAAVADSREAMARELDAFAQLERSEHVVVGKPLTPPQSNPVFVFSGMGPQWWAMGRELYRTERAFRDTAGKIDEMYRRLAGYSILAEMSASEECSKIAQTQIAQVANFLVQASLFELLASWGVHPAAIVGHSVGEVSAAYASGALELDDAVLLAFNRGRVQARAAGKGAMLAVGLGAEEALALVNGIGDAVSIAALNGPSATTLSGERAVLEGLAAELENRGVFNRLLRVEVPYHSHYMDPLVPALRESLARLRPRVPRTALYSTVTGERITSAALDADYWCRNMRAPVRFAEAISSLLSANHRCFLEVGPHPVLSTSIMELLKGAGAEGRVVSCLRREKPEQQALLRALGSLHTAGCHVDFEAVVGSGARYVRLPSYPWQRESHWSESNANTTDRLGKVAHPLLGLAVPGPCLEYECDLELEALDYLQDHVVDRVEVFPGAGYIEQGFALHALLERDAEGATLEDIEFKKALVLSGKRRPRLRIHADEATREYRVYAAPQDGATEWTLHAIGRISPMARAGQPRLELRALREGPAMVPIPREEVYAKLAAAGLQYGREFQGIETIWRRDGAALAELRSGPADDSSEHPYRLHPTLLDAAIQTTALALKPTRITDGPLLPVSVKRVNFWGRAPVSGRVWSYCEISARAADAMEANILLCDENGAAFAQVTGLRCQALPVGAGRSVKERMYGVAWEVEPMPERHENLGSFLLLGGRSELADALSLHLQALGVGTVYLAHANEASRATAILADGEQWSGLVYLGSTEPADTDELPSSSATVQLLSLVQGIMQGDPKRLPRLYVVTENAQQTQTEPLPGLMQAPVVGLGRTIQTEYPELQCTLIDIDQADADPALTLAKELTSGARETELALRGSARWVCRVTRMPDTAEDDIEETLPAARVEAFKLEVRSPGRLESLGFRAFERKKPGPRELALEIRAAALNFKDVLKALGMLPAKALEGSYSAYRLGLEASGVVVDVGDAVTEYRVGDELVLAVADSFASHVVVSVDSMFAVRKPPALSFVQAASLPVSFMTAYYGLHEVARLKRGETVLIHAAAGGVGLAAIQVAQWLGARIIATAGRESKREYVRSLGVEHVLDSRDLEFVDQVMALTREKGVDVVLNSIGGETLTKSLSILAPMGRFVELGKRDIVENKKLPMLPFNRNLSFTAFDLDRIMAEHPALLKKLFAEVWDRFGAGDFVPTRLEVFQASHVESAFRTMAQSNHTGKVVVSFEDLEDLSVHRAREQSLFQADATYLVTGGLGGFGGKVALWMAQRGARHLVLVGRSGASTEAAQTTLGALAAEGVTVRALAVDVADETQVAALLREIRETLPPLRGIIHSAAVLDDALLVNLDREKVNRVMGPKARGAWLLHRQTLDLSLDFFVLFSSVASLVGNLGQGNYVAANAFLDALALHRRALGLPAVSIDWGPLSEVGLAARDRQVLEHLDKTGIKAVSPGDAMKGLEAALKGNTAQLGFMDVDWSRWAQMNRSLADSSKFVRLIGQCESSDDEPSQLRAMLLGIEPTARAERLAHIIAELVAETMSTPTDNIDVQRPLSELGIHSLMAVELQMSIRSRIGVEFPILELTKKGNIVHLAQDLLVRMQVPVAASEAGETFEHEPRPAMQFVPKNSDIVELEAGRLARERGREQQIAGEAS